MKAIRTSFARLLVGVVLVMGAGTARARQEPPERLTPPAGAPLEAGRPFRQYFPPDVHGGHAQTWVVAQDARGLIYVGNNHRVLQYDGATWRHLPLPNESIARGMAVDADGTVYAGAQNDLGYFAPDAAGGLRFVSLRDHVPAADRDFGEIWRVHALSKGVYFQATRHLMRWDGGDSLRVWHTDTRFRPAVAVRDTFYVMEEGRGLLRMRGDSLVLVPGGEVFAERPVYAVLSGAGGGLLVGTATDGLFRREGRTFVPWPTGADSLLRAGFLYNGVRLPDGRLAFGTIRAGGVVLAADGRLDRRLDARAGVPDDAILGLFVDRDGALWLAQDGGVLRLELGGPLTVFDEALGIGGTVEQVVRHRGRLYAATREGLARLVAAPGEPPRFRPLPGLPWQTWALVDAGETLLVGAEGGAYAVRGDRVRRLTAGQHAYVLYADPADPDVVWAGLTDGLVRLRRRAGRWTDDGRLPGITEQVRSIARTDARTLWLGTAFQGLIEVTFPPDDAPPRVHRYGTADGLPEGRLYFFDVAGRWKVGTLKGLFDFGSAPGPDGARRLVLTPDTTVSAALENPERDFFRMAATPSGDVWARLDEETSLFTRQPDGRYRWVWHGTPLPRISQSTFSFFPEDDGVVWIGRNRDLIRYDTRVPFSGDAPARPLVRRVVLTRGDSVQYAGDVPAPAPRLAYALRDVRFEYALPVYDAPAATRYQVRLDGFDEDWSDWSAETYRAYTNLPEGDYRFRVRARDVYGRVSEADAYAFTVLPPWYRTNWAYLAYGLLVLGLLYAGTRTQRRLHRRREAALEAQIRERTAEIERQRDLLERQAFRLAELDRLKSRFFANITHEFRTPLTLTIGPLEDLIDEDALGEDEAAQVSLSLRNARRLLRLINQILDVSRLEAGRLQLHAGPYDLAAYLRELVQAFVPLAERKGITLAFEADPPALTRYLDPDQMEKVFGNLLSNAVKFTPEGGAVRVTLGAEGEEAVVRVTDTGPGIAPDDLAHIFERFYQTGESTSALQPGTGIGLSLVKELVELHGGTITATSTVGQGTTFEVRLPAGKAHLAPEEVAPDEEPRTEEPRTEEARERLLRYADLPEPETPDAETPDTEAGDDVPLVLVVDDNAELRAFVRRHLEPAYRILEAEDGAAALALARQHVPDLIVSDVMMPGMDGDALCRAVRADPEVDFVPVILLTARASMEGRLAGLGEGADDYLTKPFEMRELLVRVRNLIEQRRRLKARWQGDGAALRLTAPEVTPADEAFVAAVLAAIEDGMADETFSVARLAANVGQSRATLHRRLKHLSGKTPSEWILTLRLARAAALLADGAGTVSEVAYGVGFKSVSYFCKCFRERYDTTPSRYRKSLSP